MKVRLISYSGIGEIASILRRQVLRDISKPERAYFIRTLALKIVSKCPEKDYLCECEALHRWIRKRFRYAKDWFGREVLISPYALLKRCLRDKRLCQADCETLSQLYAALAMSIGHKVALLILDTTGDGAFNHVIAVVRPHGSWQWYCVELTKDVPFGWCPHAYRKTLVRLTT